MAGWLIVDGQHAPYYIVCNPYSLSLSWSISHQNGSLTHHPLSPHHLKNRFKAEKGDGEKSALMIGGIPEKRFVGGGEDGCLEPRHAGRTDRTHMMVLCPCQVHE